MGVTGLRAHGAVPRSPLARTAPCHTEPATPGWAPETGSGVYVGLGPAVPASTPVMLLRLLPGNNALRGEELDGSHTARPTARETGTGCLTPPRKKQKEG